MKADIIIFDGCDEMDALAPFEVLQRASKLGGNLDVNLATVERSDEIVSAHGVHLRPDVTFSEGAEPDILIVPGGGWNNHNAEHSTRTEFNRGVIPGIIGHSHRSGSLIVGVCTGAMLMAASGILKNRPAATHHGAIEDLRSEGANIIQARVVDDGDVVTSGGVTSGLDLCLWLAERLYSSQLAQQIEIQMEYERRGTVWRHVE